MTNKMKGLLKGLRYISQIFDEEKEQEMQIGLPTDVKHVAHIGWDGPTVDSPGWMNDFNPSTGLKSAPLGPHGDSKDNSQIKWVSEDSKRSKSINNSDSPKKKDPSTKSRQSRKHQSKESSQQQQGHSSTNATSTCSSPPKGLPDVPKKSRRKKSKESINGGGSTRSRSKATTSNNNGTDNSLNSEHGPDSEPVLLKLGSDQLSHAPSVDGDEERENRVI